MRLYIYSNDLSAAGVVRNLQVLHIKIGHFSFTAVPTRWHQSGKIILITIIYKKKHF